MLLEGVKTKHSSRGTDVKLKEDFASRKSHEPIAVTEDKEQEALKGDPGSPTILVQEVNLQVRRRRDQLLVLSGDLDGSCRQ
jgi:hypothetical protein